MSVFRSLFWRISLLRTVLTIWTPPSVIHGWKAVDVTFKKFKSINSFHPSCKASDFLGHIRNDIFLYTETLSYSVFYIPLKSERRFPKPSKLLTSPTFLFGQDSSYFCSTVGKTWTIVLSKERQVKKGAFYSFLFHIFFFPENFTFWILLGDIFSHVKANPNPFSLVLC